MSWQKIDSVPDDGAVLVYWPRMKLDDDGEITGGVASGLGFIGVAERLQGQWNGEPESLNAAGDWFGDDWEYGEPTHWMPLPEPPTAA